MMIPPVAAAQAGAASGGGLLDKFKEMTGAGSADASGTATQAAPKGDGSVGLFDGVFKKAAIGGILGAGVGFIPFIPGGPLLGGIVGALGGAAMGVFSNWRKMSAIKQENQAMLAAMGVQSDNPQVQQILQSGKVGDLIPLMQQGGGVAQGSVGQGTGSGAQTAAQQGPRIATVLDPATGVSQTVDLSTGQVVQQGSTGTQQSPVPTQGAATAVDPSQALDPGTAPALSASGGGGSAGDVGRPPVPVAAAQRSDTTAVAPTQAGIGIPTTGAAAVAPTQAGIGQASATTQASTGAGTLDRSRLAQMIASLQSQLDLLKQYFATQEQADQSATAQVA